MCAARRQHGFTVLEILIALVIIAIGLLGVAALHSRTQQANLESYQRAQALIMVEDLTNRLKANPTAASCYVTGAIGNGADPASCTHTTAAASAIARASADLVEWDALLEGAAEQFEGKAAGGINGARGCVVFDAVTGVYTVTVAWQGMVAIAAPADTCGKDAYGDDALRRVASTTLRIADLSAAP